MKRMENMGFYIKKGFNLGPVRINLSKSGVGFSLGTKGARIGSGPKGNYVHLGRKGLYYRKSIGKSATVWLILVAVLVLAGYFLWKSGIISLNV